MTRSHSARPDWYRWRRFDLRRADKLSDAIIRQAVSKTSRRAGVPRSACYPTVRIAISSNRVSGCKALMQRAARADPPAKSMRRHATACLWTAADRAVPSSGGAVRTRCLATCGDGVIASGPSAAQDRKVLPISASGVGAPILRRVYAGQQRKAGSAGLRKDEYPYKIRVVMDNLLWHPSAHHLGLFTERVHFRAEI